MLAAFVAVSIRMSNAESRRMLIPVAEWTPREAPARRVLQGERVRLEALDPARHGDDLYAASTVPDAGGRFRWLSDHPPASRADYAVWLQRAAGSEDPLHFAVVDQASGKALGRQAFMRIDRAFGVVEVGNVYWGPGLSRSAGATEALYLFARHVFDDLGYRRFEWKCNDRNIASKRAAERFGFLYEGLFRQHMIIKGESRDTAWFAMIDRDWPALRAAFERWLDPANFDSEGRQKTRLEDFRQG